MIPVELCWYVCIWCYICCRKQRHMHRRMDSSSWRHLLKLQLTSMTYFMRLVSSVPSCFGRVYVHVLCCSTIHCVFTPLCHNILHIGYPFIPIAAKRLLQDQPAPNPQAGMVLNQRPNERMVSSSSCCSWSCSSTSRDHYEVQSRKFSKMCGCLAVDILQSDCFFLLMCLPCKCQY